VKQRDTPFDDPKARFQAGLFGMWIFLIALGVLFAAVILGYVVVRVDNGGAFIPEGAPSPPGILLLSTVLLLASSATMQSAVRAARSGDPLQGRRMVYTLTLALGFLGLQAWAWIHLYAMHLVPTQSLYAWTFYVLTALHAAHVVGGLIPLAVVTRRALRARYNAEDHRGMVYCAMYWHFLDGVWLVLYATLWIGSSR
jgi:cytochrome c oxidase subunit 3